MAKSARMWAMGGFSQRRHLHHAARPASSRNLRRDATGGRRTQKPTNGSVAKMVQEYFAGDRKAYDEQVPVNAIASSGTSEQALFTGAGERDKGID